MTQSLFRVSLAFDLNSSSITIFWALWMGLESLNILGEEKKSLDPRPLLPRISWKNPQTSTYELCMVLLTSKISTWEPLLG